MKKAIKVRKSKQGVGHIYRLEPAHIVDGKEYDHAVAKSYKAEVKYGFVGFPAGSLLIMLEEVNNKLQYGPKVIDIDNVTLSETAILKKIGYTVSV